MAELLSNQFRQNILDYRKKANVPEDKKTKGDIALEGLYDSVKDLSDEDLKKYLYVNRAYLSQIMPAAVEGIPNFQSYLSVEPTWSRKNINYNEITGSDDALTDEFFFSHNMKDFEEYGKKVGMTGREFMKQMSKDLTERNRYKIAHGEDLGGWFDSPKSFLHNLGGAYMNILAPKTQERIAAGEEPTIKDYAVDIGTDVAQTLPMGKIAKVPATAKALGFRNILANAAVPAGTETAKAVLYDEDLDPYYIAKGTAVNVVTPRFLKKYGSESWDDIGKNISTKNIPFVRKVLSKGPEGTISDITTNKVGDVIYSNRATPIPVVGPMLEERKKEKTRKKEKNEAKESATRRFLIQNEEEE